MEFFSVRHHKVPLISFVASLRLTSSVQVLALFIELDDGTPLQVGLIIELSENPARIQAFCNCGVVIVQKCLNSWLAASKRDSSISGRAFDWFDYES